MWAKGANITFVALVGGLFQKKVANLHLVMDLIALVLVIIKGKPEAIISTVTNGAASSHTDGTTPISADL